MFYFSITMESSKSGKKKKNPIATKKRMVRKAAKAAVSKKSAYAAYVRDHKKAFGILADTDKEINKLMRITVAQILAKRAEAAEKAV
jgi:hypothetical protein